MSTDLTPALARATEESFRAGAENAARLIGLAEPIQWSSLSREDQEHVGIQARAAVSAALHDPDHPDALAKVCASAATGRAWYRLTAGDRDAYRRMAAALVVAILGGAR